MSKVEAVLNLYAKAQTEQERTAYGAAYTVALARETIRCVFGEMSATDDPELLAAVIPAVIASQRWQAKNGHAYENKGGAV